MGCKSFWQPEQLNSQSGEMDINQTTKSVTDSPSDWNKEEKFNQWIAGFDFLVTMASNVF